VGWGVGGGWGNNGVARGEIKASSWTGYAKRAGGPMVVEGEGGRSSDRALLVRHRRGAGGQALRHRAHRPCGIPAALRGKGRVAIDCRPTSAGSRGDDDRVDGAMRGQGSACVGGAGGGAGGGGGGGGGSRRSMARVVHRRDLRSVEGLSGQWDFRARCFGPSYNNNPIILITICAIEFN
jgi:hypothetical protein